MRIKMCCRVLGDRLGQMKTPCSVSDTCLRIGGGLFLPAVDCLDWKSVVGPWRWRSRLRNSSNAAMRVWVWTVSCEGAYLDSWYKPCAHLSYSSHWVGTLEGGACWWFSSIWFPAWNLEDPTANTAWFPAFGGMGLRDWVWVESPEFASMFTCFPVLTLAFVWWSHVFVVMFS